MNGSCTAADGQRLKGCNGRLILFFVWYATTACKFVRRGTKRTLKYFPTRKRRAYMRDHQRWVTQRDHSGHALFTKHSGAAFLLRLYTFRRIHKCLLTWSPCLAWFKRRLSRTRRRKRIERLRHVHVRRHLVLSTWSVWASSWCVSEYGG